VEIKARMTLWPLKISVTQKISDQIRTLAALLLPAKNNKINIKEYPRIPQIATGIFSMIAYGLCETVSQLIARDMAQKLL
jgi:hypothetical protein